MNEIIRSLFPAAQNYAYLNSAAVSPLPTSAIEAINGQLVDVAANGSLNFPQWVGTKERCRTMLAAMLHVRAEQVAFVRNTSDAFASVAAGIEWRDSDNIVSFANEFPANYYAWRRVRDRHRVELRLSPERNGRMDLDELISMIDSHTRVVTISSVQYASGFRADLERIGRAAQGFDALFCVDLIQGLGATGYDLPAEYVDIAAGACHKWLCGPEGIGYIYLSDLARERVDPALVGWISVETPWDFVDREQPFKPNALAWESGTSTSSLFYGLEQSLKVLNDIGLQNIEEHLCDLTGALCDGLSGKNYEIVSSREPDEKSAIVCIRHREGLHPNAIASQLQDAGVIVSPRGDRLRIAPHLYNNDADVEKLIAALP
jgi:cysteine desulfurase / selenocysteine lyase